MASLFYQFSLIFVLFILFLRGFHLEQMDLNRCIPSNLCERLQCPPPPRDCKGVLEPNASVCGCCSMCVTFLEENVECINAKRPYKGKPLKVCKPGLSCSQTTGKCVLDTQMPICLKVLKHRKNVFSNLNRLYTTKLLPWSDAWVPKCDKFGKFEPMQCKKTKCYCVDEDGKRLFGQTEPSASKNMTCGCSRTRDKGKPGLTGAERHCTKTGDFQKIQCLGNLCYCTNDVTGSIIKNQIVHINQIHILPCYENPYLHRCEINAIRDGKLVEDFSKKGISFKGRNIVSCDFDGQFSAKQCTDEACYCVDRNGAALNGYKLLLPSEKEKEMNCRCARDDHDRENGAPYPKVRCNELGNGKSVQSVPGLHFYCADEDGDQLTIPIEKYNQQMEIDCANLIEELNNFN